jgi:hypothetical protein
MLPQWMGTYGLALNVLSDYTGEIQEEEATGRFHAKRFHDAAGVRPMWRVAVNIAWGL